MTKPELRYYPLLQPQRFDPAEVGPHWRLLDHDSDPWVTWVIAYVNTTHVAYAPETIQNVSPVDVEREGIEELRKLPGTWERIPDNEIRDPAMSPTLTWESEDPYGAERLLDDKALLAACEILDARRLYVMIPGRRMCFVRPMQLPLDGDHRFEASMMMKWMWPVHTAAETPLSMHVWIWDDEQGLCGALRSNV
ncbi:MAG: hypothetical protein M4D80_41900 [Myxococcota bacterium]|nr:hypothetical protein [Myxococcota bacterium]